MTESKCYFQDCMIGMNNYQPKSFDIGILDTQYGIGEDGRRSKSREVLAKSNYGVKSWDDKPMPPEYWHKVFELCKNYFAFGVNYFQEQFPVKFNWGYKPPRREQYQEFIDKNPTNFIIWDKVNGDTDFADCELIYTSFNHPTYIKYYMWNGMLQAADPVNGTIQQGDKSKNQKRIHPTEKPIDLLRWVLLKYAKPGQRVLDTHSGSQSARIASEIEGLNYVAFETEIEYFTRGNNRYKEFTKQIGLFA